MKFIAIFVVAVVVCGCQPASVSPSRGAADTARNDAMLIYMQCIQSAADAMYALDATPSELAVAAQARCESEFGRFHSAVLTSLPNTPEQASRIAEGIKEKAYGFVVSRVLESRSQSSMDTERSRNSVEINDPNNPVHLALGNYHSCMQLAAEALYGLGGTPAEMGVAAQSQCLSQFTKYELAVLRALPSDRDVAARMIDDIKTKGFELVVSRVIELRAGVRDPVNAQESNGSVNHL